MGAAADLKVGYKTGFASGASEKKICTPTFPNVGYKQANINELMKKQESN